MKTHNRFSAIAGHGIGVYRREREAIVHAASTALAGRRRTSAPGDGLAEVAAGNTNAGVCR